MVEIVLDARKSLNENAAAYFEKAKKAREKKTGLLAAIGDVEKKIEELKRKVGQEKQELEEKTRVVEKVFEKKEWFERFHYFRTDGGRLCIAGKDAKQNELLVKHHLEEGDLFFHADVQGAAATILKDGLNASGEEKEQAAQWAACFSKAWKGGFSSVDVYAVPKDQVSKTPKSGEYLQTGSFIIAGKREWFKNTELKVAVGLAGDGKLVVVPNSLASTLDKKTEAAPGEKKLLAAEIAKKLALSREQQEKLMQMLP